MSPTLFATPEKELPTADEFLRRAKLQFHATSLDQGMPVCTASALKSIRDMAGRGPKKVHFQYGLFVVAAAPLGHQMICIAKTTFPELNCFPFRDA